MFITEEKANTQKFYKENQENLVAIQ